MRLAAFAAVVLVAAGVGAGSCGPVPGSGASLVGREAPWFRLARTDGAETTLEDVMGEKATLIDFWATWCSPCIAELPYLQAVAQKYRDHGLGVVGVVLDENAAKVAPELMAATGVTYPNLVGNAEVEMAYGIQVFPTLVLLDDAGRVVRMNRGTLDHAELERWVEEALGHGTEDGA